MSMSHDEKKAAKAAAKEQQALERKRQKDEIKVKSADRQRENAEKALAKSRTKAEKKGIDVAGAIMVASTYEDSQDQFLILFPDRIEHVKRGKTLSLLSSGAGTETIPISRISSAESKNAGIWHIVEVHTSGNTITFRTDVVQGPAIRAAILEQMAASSASTSAGASVAAAPVDDVDDQLRKLAALHMDGILTDEEFATKKAQLLERM